MRSTVVRAIITLIIIGSVPVRVSAQAGDSRAFVPPWHWSVAAVRNASSTGLDSLTSDPALAQLTYGLVRATLQHAADSARSAGRAGMAALFERQLERLERERVPNAALDGAALTVGWAAASGEARPGDGYFIGEDWVGAQPLRDRSSPAASLDAAGRLGRAAAWSVSGGYSLERAYLQEAVLTASWAGLQFWAGRKSLRFTMGRSGGLTVGPGEQGALPLLDRTGAFVNGAGLFVRDPFHVRFLPNTIGRMEMFVGRLGAHGRYPQPYIATARLIGSPFSPRITFGAYRAVVFGGEGNPITAKTLGQTMIGIHAGKGGEFDNQVLSLALSYRPPLGAWPVKLYAERGADDSSGAFRDVPGTTLGIELGAVPGLEALSLGVESVNFSPACCGNPIWYRNIFSRAGWANDDRFLAHPLGGEGEQVTGYAGLDTRAALLKLSAFARRRGVENLLAPGREGRSTGIGTRLQLNGRLPLFIDTQHEWGDGWSSHLLFGGAQLRW